MVPEYAYLIGNV